MCVGEFSIDNMGHIKTQLFKLSKDINCKFVSPSRIWIIENLPLIDCSLLFCNSLNCVCIPYTAGKERSHLKKVSMENTYLLKFISHNKLNTDKWKTTPLTVIKRVCVRQFTIWRRFTLALYEQSTTKCS